MDRGSVWSVTLFTTIISLLFLNQDEEFSSVSPRQRDHSLCPCWTSKILLSNLSLDLRKQYPYSPFIDRKTLIHTLTVPSHLSLNIRQTIWTLFNSSFRLLYEDLSIRIIFLQFPIPDAERPLPLIILHTVPLWNLLNDTVVTHTTTPFLPLLPTTPVLCQFFPSFWSSYITGLLFLLPFFSLLPVVTFHVGSLNYSPVFFKWVKPLYSNKTVIPVVKVLSLLLSSVWLIKIFPFNSFTPSIIYDHNSLQTSFVPSCLQFSLIKGYKHRSLSS